MHKALYFTWIEGKSIIILAMVTVYVWFESSENSPNMNIKKKLSTVLLEAYHCQIGQYSIMNQNSCAATAKFCYSQGSKQWLEIRKQ